MRILIRWISLCLFAATSLEACTPQIPPAATAQNSPTPAFTLTVPPATRAPDPTATPTITQSPLPSPSPSPISEPAPPPAVRYTLSASLDYDTHSVEVKEKIDYTNQTGGSLVDLALVVQPAEYTGGFKLVSFGGPDGTPDPVITGSTIKIILAQPLEPGLSISLDLEYHLSLPPLETALNKGPVPFGYTTNQTNLVDWYPFVPPYKAGSGWVIHKGNPYGEHLVYETAAFDVDLTVTGDWARLFTAASAPAEMRNGTYHYEVPAARSFAATVSHLYEESSQQAGNVTVRSFVFPIHKNAGKTALEVTVQALQLYEELFGPYPHPELTVVEADFLDGMEYDGLYFLSRGFYNLYGGTPGEYLVAIAAHETAHQWWYGLVGNDQALEPWLDEALCTYSEKLYYERYSPEGLEWWWEYRVAYYHPAGWVDVGIYPTRGRQVNYNQYRDAVYLRGAMFLEEVRKLTGDDAFFAFLKDYVQKYSGRNATSTDFFSLLAMHTDVDLTALKADFFENP